MQRIDHPDAAKANAQALHDLENGATGLTLVFAGANGARGFGLRAIAPRRSKSCSTASSSTPASPSSCTSARSRGWRRSISPNTSSRRASIPPACDIRFGLDPIGACAVWGSSAYNWWEIAPAVTGAIKKLAAQGFKGPFAVADGRVIHDAGGSEVQELAYVLALGVAYLRALEDAGVALETARGMIYARLAPMPISFSPWQNSARCGCCGRGSSKAAG